MRLRGSGQWPKRRCVPQLNPDRDADFVATKAAICIPVRNEQEGLPDLLAGLAAQACEGLETIACFYLDGCTDGSETILRRAAADFPHRIVIAPSVAKGAPNAGRARRAAMALGLAQLDDSAGAVLLTTDADSRAASGWLDAARRALAIADVVAGRIERRGGSADAVQCRLERYLDRLHAYRRMVDPVGWECAVGHHFAGGANLAFRASVYARLGGFRPLPCGEDATMLDDASRAGFRVRRDPALLVETSSRRHGRAPGGLADALLELERIGMPQVAHPAGPAWQYRAQAAARAAFRHLADRQARTRFGAMIGLDGEHVLGVGRDCPNAEAFAMRIVPVAPGGERAVPLPEAEDALALLELDLVERAA